jgi:hypothetical protein
MPEATVLATNTSNGKRWQGVTRADSRFFLEHVSVDGPYRIDVHAVGFEPAQATGAFSRWESGSRLASDSTRPLELPPLLAQRSEFADPLARHQGPRYLDMNSIQAAPT